MVQKTKYMNLRFISRTRTVKIWKSGRSIKYYLTIRLQKKDTWGLLTNQVKIISILNPTSFLSDYPAKRKKHFIQQSNQLFLPNNMLCLNAIPVCFIEKHWFWKQLDIINTVGSWWSAVDRITLLVAERLFENYFLKTDALLGRYFDAFLFEDLPASDRKTDNVYLEEVARSDLSIKTREDHIEWFNRIYEYEEYPY